MPLLTLRKLSKSYGPVTVVDQLDMEVEAGQIFALLGPNGAGKTTTISMIAGVVAPSSGRAEIAGYDLMKQPMQARAAVGLVPQDLALYEPLSARQNLSFFGSLYRLRGKELERRVDWALEVAGLRDRASEPVSHFSGGMKRRLNLSAGILHKPQLLVLDEPTVGVDPQSRFHIFDCLRGLCDEHGMTALYTSHYLDEVQELCKRVAIMDRGKIVAHDEVTTLLAQQSGGSLQLDVEGDLELARGVAAHYAEARIVRGKLHLVANSGFAPVLGALEDADVVIRSMHTTDATLESLFLHLTGHQLRDQ